MNLKTFLKLVEIQTKVASLLPFIFGTFYTVYYGKNFNVENFLLMFISLLTFDMLTTTINNYVDFKKALDENYKYNSNIIGSSNISEKVVQKIMFILLTISTVTGILLVFNSSIVVLVVGVC